MPRHVTSAIPGMTIAEVRRALAAVRAKGWARYGEVVTPGTERQWVAEDVCVAFLTGQHLKRRRSKAAAPPPPEDRSAKQPPGQPGHPRASGARCRTPSSRPSSAGR